MAALIKPIEAKSVHQIQSGQVIVDLGSVAKELVENALDADANTIEVRFKNYGLDSIEVQDNGSGISEANYEGLALKHYTSKLSTYDDLSSLDTFGFRGEALSSLCALSDFSVVTAQAHEAPKGQRLEFEVSGKLKSTTLTAAQKGSTVTAENLFAILPVRQKELTKNIKREYGKVMGLLQAYACISTKVKFTVKNAMPKGRSAVAFSTKGNATTRDNIANVYGAKVLPQLIALDLKLDFQSTLTQLSRSEANLANVRVVGHISKPVFGEGRQTPDRQLFYVNGRPCGLPQIAKAINEVYKSYNVSQSPFIFVDFRMDTDSYDVNVSPDKRTILLHNASILTDRLKEELTKKFDDTEQTVPQTHIQGAKLPGFRQLTVSRHSSREDEAEDQSPSQIIDSPAQKENKEENVPDEESEEETATPQNAFKSYFGNLASTREDTAPAREPKDPEKVQKAKERQAEKLAKAIREQRHKRNEIDEYDDVRDLASDKVADESIEEIEPVRIPVRDFNERMQEQQKPKRQLDEVENSSLTAPNADPSYSSSKGVVPHAFDSMRPRRLSPEIATITIGDQVITRMIGSSKTEPRNNTGSKGDGKYGRGSIFSQKLRRFDLDDTSKQPEQEESFQALKAGSDTSEQMHAQYGVQESHESTSPSDAGSSAVDQPSDEVPTVQTSQKASENTADRTQEEYRVVELIRMAESLNYANSKERQRRANQALKGSGLKDSTTDLVAVIHCDLGTITERGIQYKEILSTNDPQRPNLVHETSKAANEEQMLSLTISKPDFADMHIAGQFNLGFIIALRHKDPNDQARQKDELFIIDQHASDEKYNFERLQAETIVGNQRLVHPVLLDLTAVEEEIVLENTSALHQNGFIIESDTTGALPVGQRCKLLSLPLSKEVTFNLKDLEELIHLLSEAHIAPDSAYIPRPSKVRKMFAMRACRSSIMIGKTLSMRQMRSILEHMGRIDKPWNCPHGRPTMRHLVSLDELDDGRLWSEGDGIVSDEVENGDRVMDRGVWRRYAA